MCRRNENLIAIYYAVLKAKRLINAWRKSISAYIYKKKRDIQNYTNYRGIRFTNMLERIIEQN